MSNKQKLKPCPFCGSKDVCIYESAIHGSSLFANGSKYHWVECLDCDARTGNFFDADSELLGYKNGKSGATTAWNMRAERKCACLGCEAARKLIRHDANNDE